MTRPITSLVIASLLLSPSIAAAAPNSPDPATPNQVQVVEAVRSFFAAEAADDSEKLRAVTTPDFYAFDGGMRFTRGVLMDLAKTAHDAGKVYVWTVNEPEVHVAGDVAWMTYVNRGSVTDTTGTKGVTWLESAVLQKEAGTWRIHFLHSTRVPDGK